MSNARATRSAANATRSAANATDSAANASAANASAANASAANASADNTANTDTDASSSADTSALGKRARDEVEEEHEEEEDAWLTKTWVADDDEGDDEGDEERPEDRPEDRPENRPWKIAKRFGNFISFAGPVALGAAASLLTITGKAVQLTGGGLRSIGGYLEGPSFPAPEVVVPEDPDAAAPEDVVPDAPGSSTELDKLNDEVTRIRNLMTALVSARDALEAICGNLGIRGPDLDEIKADIQRILDDLKDRVCDAQKHEYEANTEDLNAQVNCL